MNPSLLSRRPKGRKSETHIQMWRQDDAENADSNLAGVTSDDKFGTVKLYDFMHFKLLTFQTTNSGE